MMEIDHIGFIITSYALATCVIAGLIIWVVADHRAQKARLQKLEAQGAARRSGAKLS